MASVLAPLSTLWRGAGGEVKKILFFTLLSTALGTTLSAQSLPRVLILDFKNKSGNASLGYLEGSITDAVTAEMKKRFTFREIPPEQWRPIATKNYFFEPDHGTDSAAMNLGLLTGQDVVVAGNINAGKNANNVVVSIAIFDIGQKVKMVELNLPLALSANMFSDIEKIASQATDTAARILPNRNEWDRTGLGNYTNKRNQHLYFSTSAGLLPYASAKTTILSESSVVSAESFKLKFNLQLQYELDLPRFKNLFAWGGGAIEFGSQSFTTGAGGDVKGSLFSWELLAGGGWHILERVRWRLSLLGGAGVYMQSVKFDYASDTVFALNSTSLGLESGKSAQALAIVAPLGARYSFRITPDVSVFGALTVKGRFFQNTTGFTSYMMLGAGYDF